MSYPWKCLVTNGSLGGVSNFNSGLALNGSTLKAAVGFIPPATFNLAKVAIRLNAETGTSPAYDLRIESDNGSGRPSGSLAWANAVGTFTATAVGWIPEVTLTSAGDVSPGTLYHLVLEPNSGGTPDASNFITWMEANPVGVGSMQMQMYGQRYNGSAWSTVSPQVCMLSNSDGSIRVGQVLDATGIAFVTNTVWYGVKWTPMVDTVVSHAIAYFLQAAGGGLTSCKVIDSGNNVLATADVPAGWWDVASRGPTCIFSFGAGVSLTGGQTYRIVWKDAAGGNRFEWCSTTKSDYKTVAPNAGELILTNGTSADGTASPTSWTDTDTSFPGVFIYGNQLSGSGGGGLAYFAY